MKVFIADEFRKTRASFEAMSEDTVLAGLIVEAVQLAVKALKSGNKLLFAGNGGSAADAQHWAGEMVSRFYYDRPGLAAIALTTDSSNMTAIGNDYGYEHTFSRQVEALGREGDILILISTSGNSPNILRAAEAARERGVRVIGFTGQGGGKLAPLSDLCFRMPSTDTPRIQEGHEFIGHLFCALVEAEMFPRP